MHPPPFLLLVEVGGGTFEPPTKFSKRRGLKGSQFLQEACWERGGDFSGAGCGFYIKNKLKCEISNNNKKVHKQNCFSLL